MNTTQIEKCLVKIPRLRNATVLASDRLPNTPIQPRTAIIVNTMSHTERGEHWVAFYCEDRIEYLDSYGRPPYQADYQKFLRRNSTRSYIYNRYRLQSYDTSVCGHYCLTYLYCRAALDMTLNDYVQLFDPAAPTINDALVRRLFNSIFGSPAHHRT